MTVIPMTTRITGGNIRVFVAKREDLEQDSEICINELCTLDLSRIALENLLTTPHEDELQEVDVKLREHLGI